MSILRLCPHIVITYATSIKDENECVRRYLAEYKKLCKECKIKDILYPNLTCPDEYHHLIDNALGMLNVALEYHVKLIQSI